MRDMNNVRLTGSIFWSKLDEKQTYATLRLGVKLGNGGSVFVTVNNPNTKAHDLVKSGNKVLINGWFDTWKKEDGSAEIQIKANDSGVAFFPKEKALADLNHVSIVGKILGYTGDSAVIEMIGDRNPKTDKPTVREAKIQIGDTFGSIVGSKIILDGKVAPVEIEGKSKLVVAADYDKITIV